MLCALAGAAKPIFDLIAEHKVTHTRGAPIVMSILLKPRREERPLPQYRATFHAAAPRPPPCSRRWANRVRGDPCLWPDGGHTGQPWSTTGRTSGTRLPRRSGASKARQGVRYHALEALDVDGTPRRLRPRPPTEKTMGEVMFRGNVVIGYLGNQGWDREGAGWGEVPFRRSWCQAQGCYAQLRDRSKEHHHFRRRERFIRSKSRTRCSRILGSSSPRWCGRTTNGARPQALRLRRWKPGHSATAGRRFKGRRARFARCKCPVMSCSPRSPKTSTKVQKFALRERAKMIEAEQA